MSEKVEDKKLGRNPFDHKKPARAARHRSVEAPVVHDRPAEPPVQYALERHEVPNSTSWEILFPKSPAWFFVDLWAGALIEPYLFWARSLEIMRRDVEPAKTPRISLI